MPDVTQIKVKEIIYDIKDAIARLRSIPSGGTTGQFLKKNSNTSYDASWADITIPEYADATSTSSGLMSANDKIKLDGFSTASNYYTKSQIDSSLSTKANLASPVFTGTPTAPTATDGTNNTQIATTQFVHNAFKANDAMVFKGTIGSSGATVTTLPATHYQGWTYKVATTGSYAGTTCEIGDMIICVTDGTSAANSHWVVVQSNIDGAVTGPASAADAHIAVFNGTSGKIIKDSGLTIGTLASKNSVDYSTDITNKPSTFPPSAHTHTADNIIGNGYLNIHPENTPTLIPMMNNDIAYLLKRGGSVSISIDGNTVEKDIANVFDASPSYVNFDPTIMTTVVIEITLHRAFKYTNVIYVDFGGSGWRAKSVKIEVKNSEFPQDIWTEKYSTTTNALGHCFVNTYHEPIGTTNGSGSGFNQMRFTFSDFNASTNTSGFRIAQIGIYTYNSYGLRETFLPKDGGDIYGSIVPYTTGSYSLGTSSKEWANAYINNLYPDKINGVIVPASPKFTDTTYTATTTSIGSASAGTAIKADDITSWSTGTLPTLGTAISADDITSWSTGSLPTLGTAIKAHNISSWSTGTLPTLGTNITADDITSWSTGSLPTLGSVISADDITAWDAGSLPSATVQNETLILNFGSLPSLSYTSRNIPNVTNVGTLPSLNYESKSIPNVTGVGTLPTLSYSEKSIPNVTGVGTLPTLDYSSKSIPNVTSVGTLPSLSYTEKTIPNISVTNKTVVTEVLVS